MGQVAGMPVGDRQYWRVYLDFGEVWDEDTTPLAGEYLYQFNIWV